MIQNPVAFFFKTENLSLKQNALLFMLICIVSALLMTFMELLLTEDLYITHFQERLSYDRILSILEIREKWQPIAYVLIPVFYLIKVSFPAICIYISLLLVTSDIEFARIFRIALVSEFIFFIPYLLKLIWFGLLMNDYTLLDMQEFNPGSILAILDRESILPWANHLLSVLNIFEVMYWISLTYGMSHILGKSFFSSFGVVASSYGIGLLFWIICITFLTVSIS